MIYDKLALFSRYTGMGKGIYHAFSYLVNQDFTNIHPGRIDLQGDDLYAIVQSYTTRTVEKGIWEAHRRYIDIHFVLTGRERIFFAPLEKMRLGDYVPEKDFLPMTGDGSPLELFNNFFVVFFPEDAHMPGIQINSPESIKKVVIKIKIRGNIGE